MNEAFLRENCERLAREVVVSERFRGDGGEPLAWRVEPISAEALISAWRLGGGANLAVSLLAAAVSVPDLQDAALQDSYGVMGAEQLLLRMLSPGEFAKLERAFVGLNL